MKWRYAQVGLLLLVSFVLGFNIIIPFLDRRSFAHADTMIFGENNISTGTVQAQNYIYGSWFWFNNSVDGTLQSITCYSRKAGGTSINLSCGIYQWSANNNAGTLLGNTYEVKMTSQTPAWYTLNMRTPVTLTKNTRYFLVSFVGNATSSETSSYYFFAETAKGIRKTTGATYPVFPNPLTGETGRNTRVCIYGTVTYIPKTWITKQSGYNTFGNTASWLTKQSGFNTFGNTASWVTEQSGWNTFGNQSSWLNQTQGYNTFGNTASFTIVNQGWNTFGNQSVYNNIDQGWNTFGNQSSWSDIEQGWNTFGHNASWVGIDQGWNTFENTIAWTNRTQGWNTFGNQSSWVDIEQGWNTFGNSSYMAILNTFPLDGETICPGCYEITDAWNLTYIPFAVDISHTNGTAMDITWSYNNSGVWTVFGQLNNQGNGSHYSIPSWNISYGHVYEYKINVSDGVSSIEKVITFGTDTYSVCMITTLSPTQFSCIIMLILFIFLFWIGYVGEKRSAGAFMLISGLVLLGLIAVAFSYLPLGFVALLASVAGFITLLGVNKWLFKPNMSQQKPK